ncbi:MAG: hypothetical protein R3F19_21050 [Verrucomicrobiales bacterium]
MLANAAVPSVLFHVHWMVVALLLIIPLETLILARLLDISRWRALGFTTLANLVSTLLGIPIGWGVVLGVTEVLSHTASAWMPQCLVIGLFCAALPTTTIGGIFGALWILPLYYYVTVFSEWGVLHLCLHDKSNHQLLKASRVANAVSYACIAVGLIGVLLKVLTDP